MNLVLRALRDFGRSVRQLIVLQVFFRIATVAVLSPLSVWLLTRLTASFGQVSATNEEILSFFFSAGGVAVRVLSGALVIALLSAEQAGPMIIGWRRFFGRKTTCTEALLHTLKKSPSLIALGVLQVGICALLLTPVAGIIWVIYSVLLSGYDINYLIAAKPFVFYVAVVLGVVLLGGLLVVYVVLLIRWVFAVPICLFERQRVYRALRESHRLVKGRALRTAGTLVVWDVLIGALTVGVVALSYHFSTRVVEGLGEKLALVIPVVALLAVVFLVLLELLFFLGFSVHALIILHFYHDAKKENGTLPEQDMVALTVSDWRPRLSPRYRRLAPWAVAIGLLLLTGIIGYSILQDLNMRDRVLVVAHRGSSRKAPENTLSSIWKAVEDHADVAEIDVQETSDGQVVLLHDNDLRRVAGLDKKIWEVSYDEIRNLDVGNWFSPGFKGERVPTLAEALDVARGRIQLNIEIKPNERNATLPEKVVKLIEEKGLASECVISSFQYEWLQRVKRLNSRLRVGYIIFEAVGDISRLDVDLLSVQASLVTEELVRSVRRRKKEIHVWTVNNPQRIARFIDLGVDGIVTDVPDAVVAMLEERATLNSIERILLKLRYWMDRRRWKNFGSKMLKEWFTIWLPIRSQPL
ncbi:MAG: glycerophosphodiester phosphodiesterase [bacterium]|nr:glycerophosphodiester phosphodiesterase [bacterium]